MQARYAVGQRVAVDIGGCPENRTAGVVRAIRDRPELTTYEIAFPGLGKDTRVETVYMAEALTLLD